MNQEKHLSLTDRWNADAEAYQHHEVKVQITYPQCELCGNRIKGNAMNCEVYTDKRKPKEVLLAQKECRFFTSLNPLAIQTDSRVFGGVFGFCIGDMLGLPVDYSSREDRDADPVMELRAYGTYHQPFGTWSGVTSMMLCALRANGNIKKLKILMQRCLTSGCNTAGGELFNIDGSTRRAIENMRDKRPIVTEESLKDVGNGALTCVLPLAFTLPLEHYEEEITLYAKEQSSITHPHPNSVVACMLYSAIVSNLYFGMERYTALKQAAVTVGKKDGSVQKTELKPFRRIIDCSITTAHRNQIRATGNAVDTLEAALWAFYQSKNYEETVLSAVNLGGNTSVVGALAGGLAGIYFGCKSIPNRWIQNIRKVEELFSLAEDACQYDSLLERTRNMYGYSFSGESSIK